MATSYTNPGGSGDRTATVLATAVGGGQPVVWVVDGNLTDTVFWLSSGTGCVITFWFPAKQIIDEAKFYQSNASAHGTWQWQGSNDHTTWTDIGGTFTLGGVATQTLTTLSGNTTGYILYRLLQVGGTTSTSPYIYEVEFKIEAVAGVASYAHPLGSGNRTSTITVTDSAGITWGHGDPLPCLVNGSLANEVYWDGVATAGNWLAFDLGVACVVQEARFYFSNNAAQGDWQFQGSPDASTWTNLGGVFTLNGAPLLIGTSYVTRISGFGTNTTSYRYYRLLGVSGAINNSPYEREIEFMVLDAPTGLSVSVADTLTVIESASTGSLLSGLAVVQTAPKATGGAIYSVAITFSTPPSVGNAVVVPAIVNNVGGPMPATCTDNHGNTYSLVKTQASSNNDARAAVFLCASVVATGSPFTITPTSPSPTYWVGSAIEVSGVGTGLVVDQTIGQSGSSATPATGSTPALAADEVFLVALHSIDAAMTTITAESVSPAWTPIFEELPFNYATGEAVYRARTGVSGTTQSCSWTDSSSVSWGAALVAFRAGGASTTLSISVAETVTVTESASRGLLPTPIAYWPFDEGTGTTAADASGNGHTATFVHGAWDTSALKKFGAAAFKNTEGGYGASFASINLGTVHSIAFWINGWDGSNDGTVIGGPINFGIYINSFGFYYFSSSNTLVTHGGGLTGSHHLAVVRNGTTVTFYKDGALLGSVTLSTNVALTMHTISGSDDGTYPFVGTVDDVRLYDVALSGAQVATLYALVPAAPTTLSVSVADTLTVTESATPVIPVPSAVPPATVVQSKSLPIANGQMVTTISFDSPPAVGNLVVVVVPGYSYFTATNVVITDNRGNSYTIAVSTGHPTQKRQNVSAWTTMVGTTGSPFTITATFTNSDYSSIVITEVTDVDPTTPIAAVYATTDFVSTTTPSLPITPAINGALLIAAVSWDGGPCTPGAGWTQIEEPDEDNGSYTSLNVERRGAPITGSYPATWTFGSSCSWQAVALAIAPKIYPPGFLREQVAVTESLTRRATPELRRPAEAATITEFVRLVPTTTLPLFTGVSETVAVTESPQPFNRTTPLGSAQHVDLQWYNLPAGTGGAGVWRSPSGFHDAVPISTDVEGSGITGWPVTVQGRFGNVRIYASTNPGMSYTFTFYKNGSPTNLIVVIADGATSGTSANEVHVVPGDTVTWKCVGVGGPSYMQALMRQTFYGDVLGESLYGSGSRYSFPKEVGVAVINGLAWDRMDSGTGGWNLPYGIQPAVVGTYGRFTTLLVDIYGDSFGPTGATRTFNLVKNGVVLDGTGGTPDTTAVFTNPVYTGGVLTLRQTVAIDVAVVPGDLLLFQCITSDPLAGYTRVYVKWGLKFVADRVGESLGGFIPWDTLYVGSGTETASTTLRQGAGWNFSTAPATMHGEAWTWRRLWAWASKTRVTGVVMTPRQNAVHLTTHAGTISVANVAVQTMAGEIRNIATDAVSVRAVSAPGAEETGPRYSFGYTQDTGDPGWYGVETVAVTDVVLPAMDIAMLAVADVVALTEADTEEETIAVLEGGDIAQARRDTVTLTDAVVVIAGMAGISVFDSVSITEAVIFPAPDLNLHRAVHTNVTVLDALTTPLPPELFLRPIETITVSELLRQRLPALSASLSELVSVTEGPMNLNADGIGTTPTPPPGSSLQDYWVVGIV